MKRKKISEKCLFNIFRKITKTRLSNIAIINLALDAYFSNPIIAENPLRIEKIKKVGNKIEIILEDGKKISI